MKNNLVTFLFVFFSLTVFAQNQSIKLVKLDVKSPAKGFSEGLGVEIFCKVEYKFAIQEFSERFYNIYPRLSDKEGNIILDSKDIKGYSEADPYYRGKDDFSIFVPYTYLPYSQGQHSCILELYATHNDSVMPVFYKGEIVFDVPEMYNYEEQEIKIENLQANVKEKSGVKGLELTFDAGFSFPSSKTKGITEKPNLRNYYFYVTISESSRPYVFIPEQSPEKSGYYSWNPYFSSEAVEQIKKQQCSLFIPFTQLQILEGSYNFNIQAHVTNYTGTIKWENLAKMRMQVEIPPIKIIKIAAKNIRVAEGEYDIAGKNIPIVNLFTGGKKKRGLGYPDVMWKVNQGFFTAYATEFRRNSHIGPDDTCFLKTTGSEKIEVLVLDFDAVGRDDELARFTFNPKPEDYKIEHLGLNKGNVLNIDVALSKNSLPSPGNISILGQTKKIAGTTGLFFKIEGLRPVPDSVYRFSVLIKNMGGENIREILNGNAEGSEFFIPWFLVDKNSMIGLEIAHFESKKVLDAIYTPYIEKPKELNDITFVASSKESFIEGIKGMELNILTNPPGDYKKYRDLFKFDFELLQDNRSVDFVAMEKSLFSSRVFLPYYKLEKGEKMLRADYKILSNNNYTVADTNILFKFEVPELLEIKLDSIYCKNKKNYRKFQSIYWEIYHGNNLVVKLEEKEAQKKMGWKNPSELSLIAHPEDYFSFKLKGLSYFGKETLIETRIITAEELSKHKKGKKAGPGSNFLKSCTFFYRN